MCWRDGGEAIQRINRLLICNHTATEILAQNGLETHGIDLIWVADDSVPLQGSEGILNHRCVIRHTLIATFGHDLAIALIHTEKAILEGGRAKVGDEDEH